MSYNLPIRVLFRLLLADIIDNFIIGCGRTIFIVLFHPNVFFLNGYLAFFDNTEMPFLVN